MLAYQILFNVLGAFCILGGLVVALRGGGSGDDNWLDTKWGRAGGTITFIIVGAVMIYLAAHDPFGIREPNPQPTTSISVPHPAPDGSPPPPNESTPSHSDSVFQTGSGNAYCATFVNSDDIGCVIKLHEGWAKDRPKSHFLYTLHPDGTVDREVDPDEAALVNSMFGLPPAKADTVGYDTKIELGIATCTVNYNHGTTCKNSRGGFRLDRNAKPIVF